MRIKKNIKYHNEREQICFDIIEVLKLDTDKSFILHDLDNDIEKQDKILEFSDNIHKFFACSCWNSMNNKPSKRPYMSIIRNTLVQQNYNFINKPIKIKIDNKFVTTMKYFIFRNI